MTTTSPWMSVSFVSLCTYTQGDVIGTSMECVCVFRRTHMHTCIGSMHVDDRGSIHVQVCQLSILNKTSVIAPPHVVAALLRREDDADGGDEDDEDIHPTSALVSELDTLAYV